MKLYRNPHLSEAGGGGFIEKTYRNSECISCNYNSSTNLYQVEYMIGCSILKGNFYVTTYEEVLKQQIDFEKQKAFSTYRTYKVSFLKDIFEVTEEKILETFTSCGLISGKNMKFKVYGNQIELLATWILGKEEFCRRVAEKTVKNLSEIMDGEFVFIGTVENQYLVYHKNK